MFGIFSVLLEVSDPGAICIASFIDLWSLWVANGSPNGTPKGDFLAIFWCMTPQGSQGRPKDPSDTLHNRKYLQKVFLWVAKGCPNGTPRGYLLVIFWCMTPQGSQGWPRDPSDTLHEPADQSKSGPFSNFRPEAPKRGRKGAVCLGRNAKKSTTRAPLTPFGNCSTRAWYLFLRLAALSFCFSELWCLGSQKWRKGTLLDLVVGGFWWVKTVCSRQATHVKLSARSRFPDLVEGVVYVVITICLGSVPRPAFETIQENTVLLTHH